MDAIMQRKSKIIIVDDEPDILDLLEKALNLEGYGNIIKMMNWIRYLVWLLEGMTMWQSRSALRKSLIGSKLSCPRRI